MWQIADCVPVGVSTIGQTPLEDTAGVLVSPTASQVIPDPQSGTLCATRQGNDADFIGVSYYDTFIRLTRDEIDMEPNAKTQMIAQRY